MSDGNQSGLSWKDGIIPVSNRFDDPYFSLNGGLDETRHVFLAGNDLPARLVEGFHVAELGFGTGLNLIALAEIATVPVRFTSFEGFPMSGAELARAHQAFAGIDAFSQALSDAWARARGQGGDVAEFSLGQVSARVIIGDVRETLPAWDGRADAWFLDGFSPAKNPEMWGEDLMAEVGRHTATGGSFATYTAAGHVRRALQAAGFTVERASGFAGKRHMSRGTKA